MKKQSGNYSFVSPAHAGVQGERRNGCPGFPLSRERRINSADFHD
jgi:hypothetical protein